ncbi:class I SAM-dependent methyltransferase [Mycolicibacterium stellerae]|uniref:class I SAM-dependent methyltransferase n=1 Tax=Mycolicibacterium stellerae TaxID=2358193 RepID=UPI0013DE78FC|nr:methyltransferase domain-containing protein [Mycolicibacterium stellerae]
MSSVSYQHFTGRSAERYQRIFVPLIAEPVSRDLLRVAHLQAGEHVLDVACGTGHIARAAAERVGGTGSVTGIDIAPDMIQVAKTVRVPSSARVDWQVAEAAALPIPDASVDVVLCQLGLMFMENRATAVAEMRRVLASPGRLVISTPGRIPPFFAALERAIVEHISPDLGGFVGAVFSMHDPEVVADLLRTAGLRDVSSTVLTTTLRLPAPAEFLWQYIGLTPMATIIEQAPDKARSALESQFVSEVQRHVTGGVTVVDLPMIVATARR